MARSKGDGGLYKDSNGLWTAVVELPQGLDEKRRRKVIRRKSKKAALDQLNELKKSVAVYGDVPTTGYTVKEWTAYWLDKVIAKNATPGTYRNYEKNIRNYIDPLLGRQKLSKLTPRHVRDFHARMAELPVDKDLREKHEREWVGDYKKLGIGTMRNTHSTLAKVLDAAINDGHALVNAAKLSGAPKVGEVATEAVALSVPEIKRLLAYIATHPMGAMWATYLLTGLRRGEVLGIEADRIDFEKNLLDASWQLQSFKKEHVDKAKEDYEVRPLGGNFYLTRPKSSSGWRILPLVEPLRSVLKLHMQDRGEGLIFTRKAGTPCAPDAIGREWHTLLGDAKIPLGSTLHGARHTVIDLLYDAGIEEAIIQQIVGHSKADMTRSYKTRSNPEQARKALEALNTIINK
ncbi:tyrosine-type recombinase/integrase [Glutamicibacter sp. AOP12-B1-11]|uniref:tyrosine-type recombinase/integrase n=1 Tax=Glutamicibacter sp. AOP12-B1-11 TaxID=3457725 RepID=UPI0040337A18